MRGRFRRFQVIGPSAAGMGQGEGAGAGARTLEAACCRSANIPHSPAPSMARVGPKPERPLRSRASLARNIPLPGPMSVARRLQNPTAEHRMRTGETVRKPHGTRLQPETSCRSSIVLESLAKGRTRYKLNFRLKVEPRKPPTFWQAHVARASLPTTELVHGLPPTPVSRRLPGCPDDLQPGRNARPRRAAAMPRLHD